ncbi:MAG: hypothetical protein ABEJ81_05195 [Haloferacaceae archaeon]
MNARRAHPSVRTTAAAFLFGLLLGTALVAPVIPPFLATLPSPTSFGPIGTVLLVGVLSIVVIGGGLVTVYFGLFLVDDA